MVSTILVILVVVVVGGVYAAWRYTQSQYYVGTDGSQVIIYRGVNQRILGMNLSNVYQRTGIPLAHVPATDLPQVKSTIIASSLAGAQKTVSNIRQAWTCEQYVTAYNAWLAGKPKPTTRKVGNKTETIPPKPYRPPPAVPKGCSPQVTPG